MTRGEVKNNIGERVVLSSLVKFEQLPTGDTGLRIVKLTRSGLAYLTKDDKHYFNARPRDVYLKSEHDKRPVKNNISRGEIFTTKSGLRIWSGYIGPKFPLTRDEIQKNIGQGVLLNESVEIQFLNDDLWGLKIDGLTEHHVCLVNDNGRRFFIKPEDISSFGEKWHIIRHPSEITYCVDEEIG